MRMRLLYAAVAAVILVSPGAVAAQGFGISAGPSAPRGALANESATGFNINGIYDVASPPSVIGFRAEAGMNSFSVKGANAGTTRIVNATGNLIVAVPGIAPIRPYLIGGIGIYRVSYSGGTTVVLSPAGPINVRRNDASDTRMGFNAGVGASIRFGRLGGLLEARYVSLDRAGQHPSAPFVPISIGILF